MLLLRYVQGELDRNVATASTAAMKLMKKFMSAAEDGSRTGAEGGMRLGLGRPEKGWWWGRGGGGRGERGGGGGGGGEEA